jgi:hypothetical protein
MKKITLSILLLVIVASGCAVLANSESFIETGPRGALIGMSTPAIECPTGVQSRQKDFVRR